MNKFLSLTMINPKITSTIVTKSFRCNYYRNLCLQRNFSKVSASQSYTFRYNINNQSSCFPMSSQFSRKGLLHAPLSTNLQSHRNFSNILRDIQKAFAPEKEDAAEESTKNAIESESEDIFSNLSDTADSIVSGLSYIISKAVSVIIEFLEMNIIELHDATGLPWWASIAITAFMFRTSIVLPIAVGQIFVMTKIRKVEVDVQKAVPAIKLQIAEDQKKFGWSEDITKQKLDIAIKRKWNGLIYNNHCNPMKQLILPLVQVPLWLSFTVATRNLCTPDSSINVNDDGNNAVYSELSTAGFGWITNLTDVDHYMILPISLALVNLAIIEVHQLFRVDPNSKQDRNKVLFFRAISLGLIPVAAYMPAATNIYWLSSSLYGLMQSFILHSAIIRYLFQLPVPEPEQKYPYLLFKKNIQLKLGMKTSKGTEQLLV